METMRYRAFRAPDFDDLILKTPDVWERNGDFSIPPWMVVAVKNQDGDVYRIIAVNSVYEFDLAMDIMDSIGLVNVIPDAPKNLWARFVRFLKYPGYQMVFDIKSPEDMMVELASVEKYRQTERSQ